MTDKLFDENIEPITKVGNLSVSDFEYLNRADRGEADYLRNLIEDWFSAFPESADKKDLRGRFRSKNNEHHLGALFELLNFVIFRKLGFTGNSHPEIQNEKSSSVDFLFSNSKKEFYLEANTTVGDSDKGLSQNTKILIDDIRNKITSDRYFLYLRTIKNGNQSFSTKSLISQIVKFLEDEDTKEITLSEKDSEFIISKNKKAVERPTQNILSYSGGSRWSRDFEFIKSSIRQKAKKYGKLDKPYIISLNCLENFNIKEELLFEILYGQEVIKYDFENDQAKNEIKKDGFFNDNFYNDRVSGLLFFPNVNAFSMLFREPVYVINPIANKILSLDVPFTIYEGVASNIKRSETGKLIYEILDIDKEEIAKYFPQF